MKTLMMANMLLAASLEVKERRGVDPMLHFGWKRKAFVFFGFGHHLIVASSLNWFILQTVIVSVSLIETDALVPAGASAPILEPQSLG